jgi:small subunit ribosomal protein S6
MSAAEKLQREYELVYILRPAVNAAEGRAVSERIQSVLERFGATVTKVDNWGKRKLAYPISDANGTYKRGVFIYVRFVAPGDTVAELERNLRIVDTVIRYQTIRLDEMPNLASMNIDPEETAFVDIEESGDDDDDEPSFEERLGLARRGDRDRDRDRDRGRSDERSEAPADEEAQGEASETTEEGDAPPAAEGDAETEDDDEADEAES